MDINDEPTYEREVYSVADLNNQVRELLEDNFPQIWVEGELSNVARPASGHMYFTLKDETAQVRCAMFRMNNRLLDFTPEEGCHVLVKAKVSLYPGRGDYQLIVNFMEETGDGALRRAFEQLKQKLNTEGLFAPEHKKTLPSLPRCIGVITSASGAAIRDILSVLKRRFANIPIIIYPTLVQGKTAASQIVDAINTANQRNECDVLLLSRGGGSLEDLWPFNEESVARAIFASELPIISGVGHEIDFTIADFVADVRAPTPSAAAELLSPDQNEYGLLMKQFLNNFNQIIRYRLQELSQTLHHLTNRLRHPGQKLQEQAQYIDFLEQRLISQIQSIITSKQHQFSELLRALDAISPLATLQRGYAIVSRLDDNKILDHASDANIGSKISAKLGQGCLVCTVDEIDVDVT